MGTSVLHIKTEVECRVYHFDEEKGIAKPGTYFNLEVRKGEQDLLFVSTKNKAMKCPLHYVVEEGDSDYCVTLEKTQFIADILLKDMQRAEMGDVTAQFILGLHYARGEGLKQDFQEAAKWFRMAAKQGDDVAQSYLQEIEGFLMDDDVLLAKNPYYLFFDTETTGVPRNYDASASNTRNWPRLVQLGWILTDEEGNTLIQGNEIVKPEGFVIPADAARVHGITTEKAMQVGKPLREVIDLFLRDAGKAKCIVGHNISFDQKVVGAELYRLGIPDTISTAKSLCTMQAGTDYCKIPGYYGYKWPKLQELHHKLFGCDFEDAHDAMADITATKKCFFEMRMRGLI